MVRVYDCLTRDHDLRLVLLAAVICLFASFTAISLHTRASAASRGRLWWLCGVGAAAGSGIWATHFVSMLAYRPELAVGYEPVQTGLSLLIAVVMTGFGFGIASALQNRRGRAILLGGAIIGTGGFVMHFVGMAALVMPASLTYDKGYAVSALLIGVSFSMLALRATLASGGLAARLSAAVLLTAAIVGLHFTGMAAITLGPAPTLTIPEATMPTEWMALGVAITTLIVLAAALAGSLVDQRFGALAEREAIRLRATVAELEETRTTLERTTADLVKALEAAAAGSQTKSQFLAAMSHELRTPLNAIIGFSEALSSGIGGSLSPRQTEYLGHIRVAGDHLLELVNEVLDLSKMDAGRLELDEEELEVGRAAATAIELLAKDAEAAGVVVAAEIAPDLPLLRADPRRLRQVLLNLLSNAIKFTPPGGQIWIRAARRDGGLTISVVDTGIGIAEADIPRALERFGQVDSRLARKYEGTGLGLPLSEKLVELHGGSLALASEQGVGTTVTITFPADRVIAARKAA
jgi:signal transduction histidine kinase